MSKKNILLIGIIIIVIVLSFAVRELVYKYVDIRGSVEPTVHDNGGMEDHEHAPGTPEHHEHN